MRLPPLNPGCGVALLLTLAVVSNAPATWSIVLADSRTREVAVGTVTCLNNYDLLAIVPVAVVGKGAGACQASGDFNGLRRPIMFEQLQLGTPPQQILDLLAAISGHSSRQYGIADTQGRMITFTGSSTSAWAGGVVGVADASDHHTPDVAGLRETRRRASATRGVRR